MSQQNKKFQTIKHVPVKLLEEMANKNIYIDDIETCEQITKKMLDRLIVEFQPVCIDAMMQVMNDNINSFIGQMKEFARQQLFVTAHPAKDEKGEVIIGDDGKPVMTDEPVLLDCKPIAYTAIEQIADKSILLSEEDRMMKFVEGKIRSILFDVTASYLQTAYDIVKQSMQKHEETTQIDYWGKPLSEVTVKDMNEKLLKLESAKTQGKTV